MKKYKTVLLDCPWPEYGGGKIKRGADRHYGLIKKPEDILRIILQSGTWRPADDAHCYMWVTNNYLPWGLDIMKWLGFTYKTNVAWIKVVKEWRNKAFVTRANLINFSLGQYFRGGHELLLFGTRGKAMKPKKALPTVLLVPKSPIHSQKPKASYVLIEKTSPGPRLEMFARSRREEWTSWGDGLL